MSALPSAAWPLHARVRPLSFLTAWPHCVASLRAAMACMQVAHIKCQQVLKTLRVVSDENLARAVALHLKRVVFIDKDVIIRTGMFSHGMYFISQGEVQIFVHVRRHLPRSASSPWDPPGTVWVTARLLLCCLLSAP